MLDEEKRIKTIRDIGCFMCGMLTINILASIVEICKLYIDIEKQSGIFIFFIPLIYFFIIEFISRKFINKTFIPDNIFLKGIYSMCILISTQYLSGIILYINTEEFQNLFAFIMMNYLIPLIVYSIIFYAWEKICTIKFLYKNALKGEYDDIIEEHNKQYEEYKKGNLETDFEIKEKADALDITSGFIKKISKKMEDNIKK